MINQVSLIDANTNTSILQYWKYDIFHCKNIIL